MDELPIVLLGLRSAWREASDNSPAELLYGQSLRLPGQLVPGVHSEVPSDCPSSLAPFFRKMREQAPVRSSHHDSPPVHLPAALSTATQVYVRHDAVRRPLQRPYDGPFAVLRRGDKTFDIQRQDRQVTVSVDRLKPAVLQSPAALPLAVPPVVFPAAVPAVPPVRSLPVWPTPASHPRREVSEEDFPPLPPTKQPFQTRAGRISHPPDRFRP